MMGNGSSALDRLGEEMSPGGALVAAGATVRQMHLEAITAVAVQVERDLSKVKNRIIAECEIDPDGLIYSWSVKNKGSGGQSKVEGPSIKMAMILSRNWGNCATDVQVIAEDKTHWTFRALFVDFEVGSQTTRVFKQRKPTGGMGRMDRDRTEDIQFQIGQSKAIRNVVVNAMPAGLVKKAMDAAKGNIRKQAAKEIKANPNAARQRAIASFARWEITREQLEERVGQKMKDWGDKILSDLRALYSALDDGQTTVDNEFGGGETNEDKGAEAVTASAESKSKSKPKPESKADDDPGEPPPPDDGAPPPNDDDIPW